jgi:hypothetical protein
MLKLFILIMVTNYLYSHMLMTAVGLVNVSIYKQLYTMIFYNTADKEHI